jgi:hypothetical protein
MAQAAGGLLPLLVGQVKPGKGAEAPVNQRIKPSKSVLLSSGRAASHAVSHAAEAGAAPQQPQGHLRVRLRTQGIQQTCG